MPFDKINWWREKTFLEWALVWWWQMIERVKVHATEYFFFANVCRFAFFMCFSTLQSIHFKHFFPWGNQQRLPVSNTNVNFSVLYDDDSSLGGVQSTKLIHKWLLVPQSNLLCIINMDTLWFFASHKQHQCTIKIPPLFFILKIPWIESSDYRYTQKRQKMHQRCGNRWAKRNQNNLLKNRPYGCMSYMCNCGPLPYTIHRRSLFMFKKWANQFLYHSVEMFF